MVVPAMETSLNISNVERVDDVPVLLAQMQKMGTASLLDKFFPTHQNWKGLSLGDVASAWLAHILSEGDHRLNSVQDWAAGLLGTLKDGLGVADLCELDFSDDRLCTVLDYMGKNDAQWQSYEREQNATLLRVYDLKPRRVRIDSTTAKSYVAVEPDGLFQFGHNKEHRPDLPQLKINQAALDPLGLPLCTTIVSGERADDPLYVPEIRKVQASLAQHGVLYVGDCKMAAIEIRTFIATSADYYLCPLPAKQMPPAELQALLIPVWSGQQALTPVQRATATEPDKPEHIADGFTYAVTLKDKQTQWCETRLVVKSFKHAKAKQLALDKRLIQAQQEIKDLNLRGRGRKRLDEAQTCAAVQAILQRRVVTGCLSVTYDVQTQTSYKRTRLDPTPKEVTKVDVTVQVVRDSAAYDDFVRTLGWRVFVCNDPELDLVEVVLAYREEYLIERGFNRLRGKSLGMTPLYINSTDRIKGLIRLLCIGLRVLCLVEYAVREALREKSEKLAGIYAGNPKRSTARPTTEMMLKAFEGITRVTVSHNGTNLDHVTPLNAVQTRILSLIGFPMSIYQRLAAQS